MAWTDISYSTSIPFDDAGGKVMPQQTLSGALTLTVNSSGAVKGGQCFLRIVGDGTHFLTCTGMKETTGSSGFDPRNGIVNIVAFWYDGSDYWYAIEQQIGAVPVDNTAPTLLTAEIPVSAANHLVLTYSEALDATSVPATSAFSVTKAGSAWTVSSVAVSGAAVTLTMSTSATAGQTTTISYTVPGSNKIQDLSANAAASLSSQAVTNSVGSSNIVRLNTINSTNVTESGDGTAGWKYTLTGGDVNTCWAASSSLSLAASTAGRFETVLDAMPGGDYPYFVVMTASTHSAYLMGIGLEGGVGGGYFVLQSATSGITPNVNSSLTPAVGDHWRIVRTGTSAMSAQISKDSGVTWTTIHNYTASALQLWCGVNGNAGNARLGPITGNGLT